MSEQHALLAAVALGLDAEQFMNSPLGRYLVDRIESEVYAALSELKQVDAEDPRHIRDLQNRVYRAEKILTWLDEVIQEGRNAERMATNED